MECPGADGAAIYQGQTPGNTITPGEIADAGAIDAYSFTPSNLEVNGIWIDTQTSI